MSVIFFEVLFYCSIVSSWEQQDLIFYKCIHVLDGTLYKIIGSGDAFEIAE